jgi:two-component sensor histidine kinase
MLPWLVLACSVLLTLLAWNVSSRSVSGRLRDQFTLRSEQIAQAISRRMQEHEGVLRGGVSLFLASKEVTREEFRDYFHHLEVERHYPGIQGIGFVALTHRAQLPELVQKVRAEGFVDFQVHPAGDRELYTPIVYIEPFGGRNLRAFGFDMFSETLRKNAMERAWRTGRPAASAIVRLVQDTEHDNQPGFLLYLPIYSGDPKTSEERKKRLQGFLYSPMRSRDLMRGILGQGPSDIDFALFEAGAEQPFYDTREQAGFVPASSELYRLRTIDVAGRSWVLRSWSRPNFGSWVSRWEPLEVLAAGVVINLLLFYILLTNVSLQSRAQVLARDMTQELKLSHGREQAQMLSSLREKETLLKEIHHRVKNNLQVVSSLLSLQRNYTQDERALEPLRQSQQRVLAMAALHEFLYQSSDLARVDTRAYLTHLVSMLSESHPGARNVAIELALDNVPLDVDRAIPCGLITNELVSNAFKYAFHDGRPGKLRIALCRHEAHVELRVEDDGPGLADPAALDAPVTLGLSLVQLLSQQLGGTLQVKSTPHCAFTITFPFALRGSA